VLAETPWQRTFAKAQRQGGLAARFTTDITRTSIPLTFADSTMATACIDRGEIRAGHRRTPVCELELELEAGVATRLFELAHTLATELPLRVEVCSKAERGYRLAWPAPVAPAHAADIDLPRNADAGAALAAIIRNCLRQIEANADGLLADADPEWVHQMRIGTRRLRSALALAHGRAPDAALAPVLSEVKWLARALGPARDLDVFALETLPALAAALRDSPMAGALSVLAEQVAARRSSARRAGREHVASARFTLFLLATGALASDPRLGAPADGPKSGAPAERDALAIRARRFARRVLKRRHRKLRAATANLPTATGAERHVARIAAKKLRYAAEFFAPLFPGKRTRSFRKALTRLQEVLGQLNDATVAAALAREIAGAQVATAAAFDGWTAAQAAALGPELAAAWRAFERATPFWTDD
jgi:triphosphatase